MRISDWSSDVCSSDLRATTKDAQKNGSRMTGSFALLRHRRFLPLFVTQLLGAFNDNLFKNAMVLFVVYGVFNSEEQETLFSAVATGLFILPFFLLSALAGQLADTRDKARSEEHTSELQSLMRISYAVFCLQKKKQTINHTT